MAHRGWQAMGGASGNQADSCRSRTGGPPGPPPFGYRSPENARRGPAAADEVAVSSSAPHITAQTPPQDPAAPSYPFQPAQHGLAHLAGVSHPSPQQGPNAQRPEPHQQPPPPPQGLAFPGIPQSGGPATRELELQKEEEERRRMEQAQHGGPLLHQPVAVGPPRAHAPNGILNSGVAPHARPPVPLTSGFTSGPVQAPGQLMAYGPPMAPGGSQQPILNDALSYLDQVKVQFADHPDVYNQFLDIMKDFKSGSIDTPGVIGRVSALFAGNPALIQGFNTFLPPGYRIECGTGDDPNSIRVTTPMGTTVAAMPQPRPLSRQDGRMLTPPAGGPHFLAFSPSLRPGPGVPVTSNPQGFNALDAARQEQQAQEQRNALAAASAGAGAATGISPRAGAAGTSPRAATPNAQAGDGGADGMGAGDRRGPVEFNHAISYVNKIKNRFSTQPDIYKQFLEILQVYQRESKPIQDVYGQVTDLFKTAPDLLDDFKQFLPESAAAAREAEHKGDMIPISHMRGDVSFHSPMVREAHLGTPSNSRGADLPPVGNFAPTSTGKDSKKRKSERQAAAEGPGGRSNHPQPGKRLKQTQPKPANDAPPPSPSLVPPLPRPLKPQETVTPTTADMAFFDRVKKSIGSKHGMAEFLKLCNLYSQDIIDAQTLVHRARFFIGHNEELLNHLCNLVACQPETGPLELKPRDALQKVNLSHCRALSPSYRLLPKRERLKLCSGRDELCNSVLNDEWASHPTWASEDSGFVAHRKNTFEESLHRIEEERHDYDFNIEACSRTIQLLEPFQQQLERMSEQDKLNFRLPPRLGGQSNAIYQRIIKKIYGPERGTKMIEELYNWPYSVIPVLVHRMKERLETWKTSQREWEKVWRDQTERVFYRSLDHQAGYHVRNDKRLFQTKSLQADMSVKLEEMKRMSNHNPDIMKQPQMTIRVDDMDVVYDTLVLLHQFSVQNVESDQPRLGMFIKEFVTLFFNLNSDVVRKRLEQRNSGTPAADNVTDELASVSDDGSSKGRNRSGNLLRSALDPARGRRTARRESNNASRSRGNTPEASSKAADEDVAMENAGNETGDKPFRRTFQHVPAKDSSTGKNVESNDARESGRLWAGLNFYTFLRVFLILYERLQRVKNAEPKVAEIIRRAMKMKASIKLGIADKPPTDFFPHVESYPSDPHFYYNQLLQKLEAVSLGEEDFSPNVEDILRRYYLQTGYYFYGYDKLGNVACKYAQNAASGEGKDRSTEVYQLFKRSKTRDPVAGSQRFDYKKAVGKLVKDGEIYRIDWDPNAHEVRFYLIKADDTDEDQPDQLDAFNDWAVNFCSAEPSTAELPNPAYLERSLRTLNAATTEGNSMSRVEARMQNIETPERLQVRITLGYKMFFVPGSREYFTQPWKERVGTKEDVEQAEQVKKSRDEEMQNVINKLEDNLPEKEREEGDAFLKSFVETGPVRDQEAMDTTE
ncbi:hypothetical protein K470DRAFT_300639 [Piedraia hortae CBS 480.64]|uniref:Histone deacetylase interacting domain-containing protein n=1 Tax=Piedraia hortae CBS 480.64 TaxID=1314780 RepID=A0A6A7BUI7_9PEZI|nr:hypothetical protein K470DRAFT_300639 [Piedraia hortae CBS 480.64]